MSVSVFDVAEYILSRLGSMSAMKLQKLVYYSQAWSLVWDEDVLFEDEIEAWANGPVVRSLFEAHRGRYRVATGQLGGDASRLDDEQRKTVDAVCEFYGARDPQWLSDLTHMEDPWRIDRVGIPDGERSGRVIEKADIQEYYSSL